MELSDLQIEGKIGRAWLLGRRELHLHASASVFHSEQDPFPMLGVFKYLYRSFCQVVSPALAVGKSSLEQEEVDLLAILANFSRRNEPSGMLLKNLRGAVFNLQSSVAKGTARPSEPLLEVRGISQIPVITESGKEISQEEWWCSMKTRFQKFSSDAGVVSELDFAEHLPSEFRATEYFFPFRDKENTQITSFRFSWEEFAATSFGLSLGLVPRVRQRTKWKATCRGGEKARISMYFYRELGAEEKPEMLADIPSVRDFSRALEAQGLYTGFENACISHLRDSK